MKTNTHQCDSIQEFKAWTTMSRDYGRTMWEFDFHTVARRRKAQKFLAERGILHMARGSKIFTTNKMGPSTEYYLLLWN